MKRKYIVSLVLCLLLLGCMLPTAAGAETIDPAQEGTLTVELFDGSAPVESFPFALYYAASVSAQGEFTLAGDFRDCRVEVNGLTEGQYADLVGILDAYAQQNGLVPLERKSTDASGRACFDGLKTGLYLVGSSTADLAGERIAVEAFLVSLPGSSDGVLSYRVTAQPKHSTVVPLETVTRRVWKAWDDAGFTGRRPESVTVELLCDGQIYGTRVLNTENNWQYVWKDLPAKDGKGRLHVWTLRERAVADYEASIWEEGDTFLVRNTYIGKKLPQTGQLWWPVAVLSAAGAVLTAMNLFLKKRRQ